MISMLLLALVLVSGQRGAVEAAMEESQATLARGSGLPGFSAINLAAAYSALPSPSSEASPRPATLEGVVSPSSPFSPTPEARPQPGPLGPGSNTPSSQRDGVARAAILRSAVRLPEAPSVIDVRPGSPVDQQVSHPSGTAQASSPPPPRFQSWLMQAAGVAGSEAQRGVALAEGLVPELKTLGMAKQAAVESFTGTGDFFPWPTPVPTSGPLTSVNGTSIVNNTNIVNSTNINGNPMINSTSVVNGSAIFGASLINSTNIVNSTNIGGHPVINGTNIVNSTYLINSTNIGGYPVINSTNLINSTSISGFPVINGTNVVNGTNNANAKLINRNSTVGDAGLGNGIGNNGTGNGNGNGNYNNNDNVLGDTKIGVGLGGANGTGLNTTGLNGMTLTIASPHSQAISMTGVNLTLSNVTIFYVAGAGGIGGNLSALNLGNRAPVRSISDEGAAVAGSILSGSSLRTNNDGTLNAFVAPGFFVDPPEGSREAARQRAASAGVPGTAVSSPGASVEGNAADGTGPENPSGSTPEAQADVQEGDLTAPDIFSEVLARLPMRQFSMHP